jgi:hypothetical protein
MHELQPKISFPQGFFFIKCHKNGMVLDVERESTAVNAKVIVWPQKPHVKTANQQWCFQDGFLHNKKSNLVLDVKDGRIAPEALVIQHMKKVTSEAQNQLWGYDNGYIYLVSNPNLVLDVKHESDQQGAKVIIWNRKTYDHENQLWDLEPNGVSVGMPQNDEIYTYRTVSGDEIIPEEVPPLEGLQESRRAVYAGKMKGACLTHEIIAGAAACQAVETWEEKQQKEGKVVVHQVAKHEIINLTIAEVESLAFQHSFEGDIEQTKASAVAAALAYYDRQLKPMYSLYHI